MTFKEFEDLMKLHWTVRPKLRLSPIPKAPWSPEFERAYRNTGKLLQFNSDWNIEGTEGMSHESELQFRSYEDDDDDCYDSSPYVTSCSGHDYYYTPYEEDLEIGYPDCWDMLL